MNNTIDNSSVKNICVLMMGLLGDVLMRTPVVRELKIIFSNAKITCIADKIGAEILSLDYDIDEIKIIERSRKNKLKYLYSKLDIQMYLLKEGFDLIIDLYGGKSSNNMMKLNFIKYKAGFVNGKPWSNVLEYKENMQEIKNPFHLTHQYFSILNFFTTEYNNSIKPVIFTKVEEDKKMKNYLESLNIIELNKIYLVSFGSGGIEKILDLEVQCELIAYIYRKYGFVPAIVLNPGQEFLQEKSIEILKSKDIPYIQLKVLNLKEIASVMKNVKFTMVPDTGLYHMAVGISIPIFCIFTYTNPLLVFPDEGTIETCFLETEAKDVRGVSLGTSEFKLSDLTQQMDSFLKKDPIAKLFR